MSGLATAIRVLTLLPNPEPDARRLAPALKWYPVVGLAIGLIIWLALAAGMSCSNGWALGSAAVALMVGSWLTRAGRLDSLGHAMGALGAREGGLRPYEVMKDPHIRASGVVAIALAVLIKWIAIARLAELGGAVMIVAAYTVSRAVIVELAGSLRYAREEKGLSAALVESADPRHAVAAMVVAVGRGRAGGGALGVGVFLRGWVMTMILAGWMSRVIGGVTDELLGACSEVVEAAALLISAMIVGWLPPHAAWELLR